MPRRLYILAGEASGDLHASNLLKALKTHLPEVETRGIGGDRLKAEGMHLIRHIDTTSFMGFVEVAMNLRTINKMFGEVKRDIKDWQPDAVLFVDYPGFNLRMAKWVQARGIQTIWYISPQVWAWGQKRLPKMKARIDHMMCILPFEQGFFRTHGIEVAYVGHPLLDAIEAREDSGQALYSELDLDPAKPVVALLPGSRTKEIARLLPTMLRLAGRYPEHQFVIAGAPGRKAEFYAPYLERELPNVRLVMNRLQDLLQIAARAIVCSGTATLETALFGVPQIVVYRGDWLSYQIAKRVVGKRINYISLVNLILDEPLVAELIQGEMNLERLVSEYEALKLRGEEFDQAYARLRELLGAGEASEKAGRLVANWLNSNSIMA